MVNGGSEATTAPCEIYYLLGMGGRLAAGLGEELLLRGFAPQRGLIATSMAAIFRASLSAIRPAESAELAIR